MSPRTSRRRAGTAVAVCTALAVSTGLAVGSPAAAQSAPTTVDLQILGINDFHGHLDPGSGTAPSVAGVLGGAVNALTAQNPNTLFVSVGDNIGASPFISSSQRDEPTLDVLDQMGLDVSAVGNHEFDRGYRDLADRVVPDVDFPFLGANVDGETPDLAPYTVEPVGGVRVGFIGVVTQDTATLVSPGGIPGITFSDPVAAANRAAQALSDGSTTNGEADVIVLLAHEGAATAAAAPAGCAEIAARDDVFGRIVRDTSSDVDAILGGHTHLTVDCEFALPSGQVRPVLEASEYGKALDRLVLTYDTTSRRVTAATGEVIPLTPTAFPADPAVEALVKQAQAAADVVGREVIGTATVDITRATTPAGAEDRGSESLLGNFIADVQLDATSSAANGGAQIAFMNPGGLRADLVRSRISGGEQVGEITYAEAAVVQPFANTLFTLTLTGAQVKQVLEEQYQPEGASRPFLALGVSKGVRYELHGANPRGSRIADLTLNGVPVDPSASYRIVTNSFLATGGDNFRTLGTGTERRDTGLDDLTVLVAYLRANSPVTPDPTDRAVLVSSPSAPVSPSPSATATVGPEPAPVPAPSPSLSPTTAPSATPTPTPVPSASSAPADACAVRPTVELGTTTITATGAAEVTVRGRAGETVDLYAATRPSTAYRVVRTGVLGADGTLEVAALRPPSTTRLHAVVRGCPTTEAGSVVLSVRTALTLAATRTGRLSYVFRGDSLPARPGGLLVSLYRVNADGSQVLTARTRADGRTGEWRIARTFTGSGRFGFVVRTGADALNAPGVSNVRPTLVF